MKVKAYIFFDKTKSSRKIKSSLENKIQSISLTKSKLIIVIGGDGFMLKALKKFYKLNKFFYGVNSGHYGFLMNRFSSKKFFKKFDHCKINSNSSFTNDCKNKK